MWPLYYKTSTSLGCISHFVLIYIKWTITKSSRTSCVARGIFCRNVWIFHSDTSERTGCQRVEVLQGPKSFFNQTCPSKATTLTQCWSAGSSGSVPTAVGRFDTTSVSRPWSVCVCGGWGGYWPGTSCVCVYCQLCCPSDTGITESQSHLVSPLHLWRFDETLQAAGQHRCEWGVCSLSSGNILITWEKQSMFDMFIQNYTHE